MTEVTQRNYEEENSLIQYNDTHFLHKENVSIADLKSTIRTDCVNWIDLETIDRKAVDSLTSLFDIHHLIVEDILDTDQLPKFELFDRHLFFTTKMLSYDKEIKGIREEHLNIVLSGNLIITFQEGLPGDVFGPLRQRIKQGLGPIRKYKSDFLFYQILNAVMDNYLKIMEILRNRIEDLETISLEDTSVNIATEVIQLKKETNLLRAYTLPMRDALNKMRVESVGYIQKSSINYYQDLSDQLHFLVVSFETSREMLKDLMDLHRSNQNTEMNKVMKTLTVISAIFIPLTFVAGVYGMNFRYMPELDSKWGYFTILGTMIILAGGMAYYMKVKKWF